jgi:hypothetical protein
MASNGQFMNRHYRIRRHVASDLEIEEVTESVHHYNNALNIMRPFCYHESGEYYQMFRLEHQASSPLPPSENPVQHWNCMPDTIIVFRLAARASYIQPLNSRRGHSRPILSPVRCILFLSSVPNLAKIPSHLNVVQRISGSTAS